MAELDGPYLQGALLCERVIEDKEGVLTLVRLVDRILVQAAQFGGQPGSGPPAAMPAIAISLSLVLIFKSGPARGTRRVGVNLRSPAGLKVGTDISLPLFLEGDDRGQNLVLNIQFSSAEEGLYWFDVLVEERVITKVPLRILYQPMSATRPPSL